MNLDIFYGRLSSLYKHSGKTQKEVCDASGVTTSTLSRLLSGPNVPDTITLVRLSKYFNVSIDWLLGFDEINHNMSEQANRLANYYDKIDESDKIIIQAVLAKYQ